ncbi:MAG: YbjQ family protein [Candidatus Micrarchaeota archaeon]|nr:YbjQ family protein [Candidatus Micrarchaeota archaeon]
MLVVTTEDIPGKTVKEALGLVKGNTVRAKWFGKDIVAGLRNIVGGEVKEYTEMMTESRNEAMLRMIEDAEKLDADAIVGVRFMTSQTTAGAAEFLAYGTAVKLKR